MDPAAALAAFDEQMRRNPGLQPGWEIARRERVVRVTTPGGWNAVVWSDLDEDTADATIAEQVQIFAALGSHWEWKYYSYDQPADLPERLKAAGLVPDEEESLMVAETADLLATVLAPTGVDLMPVIDAPGVDELVWVHDAVFGGDHRLIGEELMLAISNGWDSVEGVVARSGSAAVAAGRVEFHPGREFASLWGGGTRPEWRRQGVFTSLVRYRASRAAERGYRYLQVDASADSRPILAALGFVELAKTVPYLSHPST